MRGEFAIFFENYIFKFSSITLFLLIASRAINIPALKKPENTSNRYGYLIIYSYMVLLFFVLVLISFINTAFSFAIIFSSAVVNVAIVYDSFKHYGEHNFGDNEIVALFILFNVFFYASINFSNFINNILASSLINQFIFISYKSVQYYFIMLCAFGNILVFIKRVLSLVRVRKQDYNFDPYLLPDSKMLCKAHEIDNKLRRRLFLPVALIADMWCGFGKAVKTMFRLYILKPLIMLYRIIFQDWLISFHDLTETYLFRMSSKYSFMFSLLCVYIVVEQGKLFSTEIASAYGFVSTAIILPIIITDALTYRDKMKSKENSQTS